MKEQIKILENDIKDLIQMIKSERELRKPTEIITNIHTKKLSILKTETNENKDYNDYKKLIDTLISNFRTYLRFKEVKYDNEICIIFKKWCESEINIVHDLMNESKEINNYNQYRCLNYIYIKLLGELNSYSLSKPIEINNNITIEVKDKILSEVLDEVSKAWNRLNNK